MVSAPKKVYTQPRSGPTVVERMIQARSSGLSIPKSLLKPDMLDKMIDWKNGDPRLKSRSQLRKDKMQTQYSMELRTDFADKEKAAVMKQAFQAAARHVLATARLLADQAQPQILVYSDDFVHGHEDIALLDDTLAEGQSMIGATGTGEDKVNAELLEAFTDQEKR